MRRIIRWQMIRKILMAVYPHMNPELQDAAVRICIGNHHYLPFETETYETVGIVYQGSGL